MVPFDLECRLPYVASLAEISMDAVSPTEIYAVCHVDCRTITVFKIDLFEHSFTLFRRLDGGQGAKAATTIGSCVIFIDEGRRVCSWAYLRDATEVKHFWL